MIFFLILLILTYSQTKSDDNKELQNIFKNIYEHKLWFINNNVESVSGPGSSLHRTNNLRKILPDFINKYKIEIFLDAACGDLNWMKEIINSLNIKKYIACDIVSELIQINKSKFIFQNIEFINLDIVNDELPKADLIFCRDCFIHLSKNEIIKAIKNFKKSGSKYLLMTHYKDKRIYQEIPAGHFRQLNFTLEPFNFPEPIEILDDNENYPNHSFDKCLALWKLVDIKI